MKLVDHAKAHLIVAPVGDIGGLITAGAIRIGARVGAINDEVGPDDVITVDPVALSAVAIVPQDLPLTIVHEDDELLICDKPAGMHVHPLGPYREGTLLNALLWHAGARPDQPWAGWRPRPLHRLDRAASGLMAIGKTMRVHAIQRRYRARVEGVVAGDGGTIDAPLGRDPALDYRRAIVADGQPAVTHWRVLERGDGTTLVELDLETGRTHQIRTHLASLGHPIVGDVLYGAGGPASERIALHAHELRICKRVWFSVSALWSQRT